MVQPERWKLKICALNRSEVIEAVDLSHKSSSDKSGAPELENYA